MFRSILSAPWFGRDQIKAYAITALVLLAGPIFFAIRHGLSTGVDFGSFWSAGRLAWSNPVHSYQEPVTRLLLPWSKGILPFPYPPPFLLVVAPFGLLPFPIAFIAFVAVGLCVFICATRSLKAPWPSLAFPATWSNAVIGQNGLLTGSLFIGATRLLDRRPFVAGMLFGGLVIKPHLAILVPVALVVDRRWRAFLGAAVSSLGLLALSWAILGGNAFAAALNTILAQRDVPMVHHLQLLMQTPFTMALAAGVDVRLAAALQIACALTAAGLVAAVWRGNHETEAKCAVLASATVLVTPYLYAYDLTILLLPIVWLARRSDLRPAERLVIFLAFISPTLSAALAVGALGFNPGSIAHAMLLAAVARRLAPQRRLAQVAFKTAR